MATQPQAPHTHTAPGTCHTEFLGFIEKEKKIINKYQSQEGRSPQRKG